MGYDKKKMLKNGYIEVTVEKPVKGVEEGEKVLTLSNEFGQMDDDADIVIFKEDEKMTKVIIHKENVKL